MAITNKVPSFRILLDNRRGRWNDIAEHNDIFLIIDGVPVMSGFIDTIRNPLEKIYGRMGGDLLWLEGRGDAAALLELLSNIHLRNHSAKESVEKILGSYNSLKGTLDPTIFIEENAAPASKPPYVSFQVSEESHWGMLDRVSGTLGAPVAFGGQNKFYDFWITPTRGLVFVEAGSKSSGITITVPSGYGVRSKVVDSLPRKTDIWVTGSEVSGTIPLEMQAGWGNQGPNERKDPWTETNGQDYFPGTNCYQPASHGPSQGSQFHNKIGDWMIGGSLVIPKDEGSPMDHGYFYMRFPFPDDGSKWPSQDPAGGLNTFNMTRLDETMREISAIGFFIRCMAGEAHPQFRLEVVDGTTPTTIASKKIPLTPDWIYFQYPFGPSAQAIILRSEFQEDESKISEGQWKMIDVDGSPPQNYPETVFDWSNIAEIRFVGFAPGGSVQYPTLPVLFIDGLRFIKPLIAHYYDPADPVRRPDFHSASWATSYSLARIWAAALAETLRKPLRYLDFDLPGRADIIAGYTFIFEGKTLIARTLTHRFTKDSWKIGIEGFEAS